MGGNWNSGRKSKTLAFPANDADYLPPIKPKNLDQYQLDLWEEKIVPLIKAKIVERIDGPKILQMLRAWSLASKTYLELEKDCGDKEKRIAWIQFSAEYDKHESDFGVNRVAREKLKGEKKEVAKTGIQPRQRA